MSGSIKIRTQKNITENNLCFIHHGERKTKISSRTVKLTNRDLSRLRMKLPEYHLEVLNKATEDMIRAKCH